MAEKDYETIEGGDDSSDAFDFESTQVKPTKDKDEGSTSKDEEDFRNRPPEKHRIEGGDTEWDDEEGADLEDSGEKKEEAKEVEEVEKEEVKEEEKELTEEEKQDEKIKDDVIKYLSEEEGGTKYRVKGKEYDMRDLSPQEFRDRFSKAGRFEQRMEEMAAKEKIINERERLAEDGARRSQEIMRKWGGDESGKVEKLPDFLKPDDDDDDEVRALKEYNANLTQRVDKLESGYEQQGFEAQRQDLFRQLDSLEKEFPMLSKSEVIAVKSMPEYANVDMRVIAENSHNARIGDEYLDAVFKTRPDKLREIEENAIEKHLMKNPKVKKVSRKKSSTVASGKVSSGKKKSPRTLDGIEAHVDSHGGWDNVMPDTDED